jgi:diamine N-acetyltransferase
MIGPLGMSTHTVKHKLRPLQNEDAPRMFEWLKDKEVTRYLTLNTNNSTLEDTLHYIDTARDESCNLHRAIVNEDDLYLGTVSLKCIDHTKGQAEYAIAMHSSAIGTGAAAAGSKMILALAFDELGLSRVYLNVLSDNQRAVKLYNKLGFVYTHSTTKTINGEYKEALWYEIVAP